MHLVGILCPHINDDARSKSHQIHNSVVAFRSFPNAPKKGLASHSQHASYPVTALYTRLQEHKADPMRDAKCNAQVNTIVTALLRTGLRSSSQPDTEWRTKNRYTTSSVALQRNWFSSVTPRLSKGPAQCLVQIVSLDLTQLTDLCVSPTRPGHLT